MQSIRDAIIGYAAAKRDELITAANNGDDDDLPPEERPNRASVAPGCRIKFGDELDWYGVTVLYVCPGRGANYLYGLTVDGATIPLGSYDVAGVTDRIPADPEEDPLPIFEPQGP